MGNVLRRLNIDNFIKDIIKYCLRLFWLIPIRSNKVLLMSYEGQQYSCNPKYISNYLNVNDSSYEIIWLFKDIEKFKFLTQKNIKLVKYGTLEYLMTILTAKVIITNNRIPSYLPIRKSQIVINTWHGGGAYKKVVSDDNIKGKRSIEKGVQIYDIFISTCKKNSELMIRGTYEFEGKILETGFPRNDIFFTNIFYLKEKVYKHFNINDSDKIVLYAPTYRDNSDNGIYDIDIECLIKSLEKRFGGKWIVMVRGHHRITSIFDFNKDENIINVTDYQDMQELLCAADLLITDYSSSIWDFSLMSKPSILFAKDLDQYKKERDFYVPIEEWHFPIVKSNEELVNYIENFDEIESSENIQKHLDEFGSFETGNATEAIVKEIKKIMES